MPGAATSNARLGIKGCFWSIDACLDGQKIDPKLSVVAGSQRSIPRKVLPSLYLGFDQLRLVYDYR